MQWNYYKKVFADTWIRSLKADTILQISDTQIPGLYLRYYPSTKNITFYLGYMVRKTKTHRNLCLGKYGIFTLKEIRKRALDYRQQISEGQDPVMDLIAEQKRNTGLVGGTNHCRNQCYEFIRINHSRNRQ